MSYLSFFFFAMEAGVVLWRDFRCKMLFSHGLFTKYIKQSIKVRKTGKFRMQEENELQPLPLMMRS
jgi:hypothetical protein